MGELIGTKEKSIRKGTLHGLRRRFVRYALYDRGTDFDLVEIYEELDISLRDYVTKEVLINLSKDIKHNFVSAHSRQQLLDACTRIRQDLDQYGLKIFFDPAVQGDLPRPKWRYRIAGKTHNEHMALIAGNEPEDAYLENPNQMPERIARLTVRNYRYHTTSEWKNWFGRKLQRKREQIMSGCLFNEQV